MDQRYKFLYLSFAFSFFLLISFPIFIPYLSLSLLTPPLVLSYYRYPLQKSLWISCLCGLVLDLLCSYEHLGLFSMSYALSCWLIYPQKQYFFEDHLSTLPVMTFLLSLTQTALLSALLFFFEGMQLFSWRWWMVDGLLYSLLDALYAFLCFSIPYQLFAKPSTAEA